MEKDLNNKEERKSMRKGGREKERENTNMYIHRGVMCYEEKMDFTSLTQSLRQTEI